MGDRFHHVSVPLSHSADDGSPRKETGMFVCMFLPVTKRKYFTLPRGQFTNNECMPSKPFAAFLYFLYKRPLLTQPVQCKQWRVFHFDLTTPTQHHASISTAVMSLKMGTPPLHSQMVPHFNCSRCGAFADFTFKSYHTPIFLVVMSSLISR